MLKKIISLVCIFSCVIIFAAKYNLEQLTSKELSVYKKIMNQYQQNPQMTHSHVELLLKLENLSIYQLYNILQNKSLLLLNDRNAAHWPESWTPRRNVYGSPSPAMGIGNALPAIISLGSLIIGTPLLLAGLAIKKYMAPSTVQKVASYGFMTTGGITLIPEIAFEFIGEGVISGLLIPGLYKTLDHIQESKYFAKITKIDKERNTLIDLMLELKKLYPELTTPLQSTSP